MAAGAKNLEQIMLFTERGLLTPGGRICDIGASQLKGDAAAWAAASFLDYFASRPGGGRSSAEVGDGAIAAIADGGFLGELLELAGFDYVALDIFHAKNTILFDLNAHEPGPGLAGRFDLVLNFGTTEHIFNQHLAQKTIFDLLKVGGIAYHDLPMSGYFRHGYFKYDPQFFQDLARANGCATVLERMILGGLQVTPDGLEGANAPWHDYGLEFAMTRASAEPMRLPLETSTSLDVDAAFAQASSDLVRPARPLTIVYAAVSPDAPPVAEDKPWPAPPRLRDKILSRMGLGRFR